MKRSLMVLTMALAACEGEPPKVPAGAAAPVMGPETVAATSAPDAEAAPAPSLPAPVPAAGPCCQCNCTTGDAGDAAPTGLAAAGDAGPVEPAVAAKATLTGTITTTPAAAAANAVIDLEDAPIEPTAKMSATVDNRQMTFAPFLTVIPVGGRVVFHNSDPFPHNVFSPDNEKFNLGTLAQGMSTAHVFKKAGTYTLLCNLHPGMLGYVFVSPSSYFARADAKGHYAMKDVPAGTYKVTAWAPRQQAVTQPLVVHAGEQTLDFQLHR